MYSGVPQTYNTMNSTKLIGSWKLTSLVSKEYCASAHLLVDKLPGVFLNVALIQIGCHVHKADFGEPEVSEFNVPHWSNQEAVKD